MNDSFDRSLIVRDHQRPIVGPLEDKIKRAKKIFLALIISSLVLLIVTIIVAVIPTASQDIIDENKKLKEINSQLKQKNNQLNQDLTAKKELNSNLSETKISQQAQLKLNNDLIVFLQNDIKLNCNPLKQRLRFNGTNMNALTLSVQKTNSIDIPEIIFLNVSDNKLTSFSDNSLPNIEYLDLTKNPISKISNNKLDKVFQIGGVSSQPKLYQFSSNFLPLIKNLTLNNNNITIFTDNNLNTIKYLDLSSNKLTAFSNFNYSNLQFLDISLNPIVQFNGNKFQNLAQITTLFTSPVPIVFNENFFGKANSIFIRYKFYDKPTLAFTNNYFPYLTNLSLGNLTLNYITFTTNNMPVLAHLKFYDCKFSQDYEYPKLYRNLITLEFHDQGFEKFTNLTYPNLTVLIVNNMYTIRQFSNNNLPQLRYLELDSHYYIGNLQNNFMPKLKTLNLHSFQIKDPNFIRSLQSLQQLFLQNIKNMNSFDNYVFPHLTTLYMSSNGIQSFQNNSLPSLTNLTILENCTINLDTFIDRLQHLHIYHDIINLNFPRLNYLEVYYKFMNNTLSQLQKLVTWGGANIQSNEMPSVKSIFIIDSETTTFPSKFDQTLQQLIIVAIKQSRLTSFDKHNMPNLQKIFIKMSKMTSFSQNILPKVTEMYLSSNQISMFDCDGLKDVKSLNLSNNLFNDSIIDKIINCRLPNISILDLSNNSISNPSYARNDLSNAYPNALIKI